MDVNDIKEKLIVVVICTAIFLPLRVSFSYLIPDNLVASLGVVSFVGILFIILIKKKKLGSLGEIFERQLKKTIGGKMGKWLIGISLIFMIYFGASLLFIDRGNTLYLFDKEVFLEGLESEKFDPEKIPVEKLKGPNNELVGNIEEFLVLAKLDYAFSISLAIMNYYTDGWLSHFIVVIFVEQLELIGFLLIYRKTIVLSVKTT